MIEDGLRKKKLFSIVTVVYNGQKHIEQTIQSVLSQKGNDIEYIIVDGKSTDNTLSIIKKYEDKIDYWISEKDNGIYNAMNKGIDLCTGKYIGFINADDWYEENIFDKLVQKTKSNPDYIVGDVKIVNKKLEYVNSLKLDIKNFKRTMPFGHPALFVKKEILNKYKFDEKYKIVSDYDFCIKLILNEYRFEYLPAFVSNFRLGGVSNTLNTSKELFKIQQNHFGFIHAVYWYLVRSNNPIVLAFLKIVSTPLNFIRKFTR